MTETARTVLVSEDLAVEQTVGDCFDCSRICAETLARCMAKGGELGSAAVLGALMDAAELSRVTADLIVRRSPLYPEMTEIAIAACLRCAAACEALLHDPHVKACGMACRDAADACGRLIHRA